MKKVVINVCFGGFGLSKAAYEKLIEWGVPVRKYVKEVYGEDGRYTTSPENEGEVLFDRDLTPPNGNGLDDLYWKWKNEGREGLFGRYWERWIEHKRDHPLLVRLVQEMGEAANDRYAKLRVVEIPDDVDFQIEEYDGNEHIAEKHRVWS